MSDTERQFRHRGEFVCFIGRDDSVTVLGDWQVLVANPRREPQVWTRGDDGRWRCKLLRYYRAESAADVLRMASE